MMAPAAAASSWRISVRTYARVRTYTCVRTTSGILAFVAFPARMLIERTWRCTGHSAWSGRSSCCATELTLTLTFSFPARMLVEGATTSASLSTSREVLRSDSFAAWVLPFAALQRRVSTGCAARGLSTTFVL